METFGSEQIPQAALLCHLSLSLFAAAVVVGHAHFFDWHFRGRIRRLSTFLS
jgi:hypothetical protein